MFRSLTSAQEAIKDLRGILAELDQELEHFWDVVGQVEALMMSFLIADSILSRLWGTEWDSLSRLDADFRIVHIIRNALNVVR